MNPIVTPEIREIMEASPYHPAISIIMPFEPKMGLKRELTYSLKMTADKVERELQKNYPVKIGELVIQKLRSLIGNLNFNTHKKSIAIFVSPVYEKVLYLDIAVEEKIIVDESFEIRELIYCKKQLHQYLVLFLSSKESNIYLDNSTNFARLVSNIPESAYAYINDAPERVANFSDSSERKEVVMEKFLHHIDNSLDIILNAYRLPLFLIGPKRILGHFKKLTRHSGAVVEFIQGNYEEATEQELKKILEPKIADWQKVKEKDLQNQLEAAAGKLKLAIGMKEVWREAMNHNGRLLLVEKDYRYAVAHESNEEVVYKAAEPFHKFSYIKDAVDVVIEKVLENGGDVEFVEKELLQDYHQIALIKFY